MGLKTWGFEGTGQPMDLLHQGASVGGFHIVARELAQVGRYQPQAESWRGLLDDTRSTHRVHLLLDRTVASHAAPRYQVEQKSIHVQLCVAGASCRCESRDGTRTHAARTTDHQYQ